jgi:cytochrome c
MFILLSFLFQLGAFFALMPPPPPPIVGKAEDGQKLFRQCAVCHPITPGGRNTLGPNLLGVFDRQAGVVPGYNYSTAMRAKGAAGLTWSEDNLRGYLANPRSFLPGGSMSYRGMEDAQHMADMIAYLQVLK